MAAQRGRDMLIRLRNAGGTFEAVAGLRSRRLAFGAEAVDITHAESAGRWRELLAGAGVKRASLSGTGIFKDATSDARMRQLFFDGLTAELEIVVPDFGTIAGPFHIGGLELAGDHDGELTWEMTFESAGSLTFAPL